MKTRLIILFTLCVFGSAQVQAQGWLDSIKDLLGIDENQEETSTQPTVDGLLSSLSGTLGVTDEQAEGGLASLLNYAKNNVDSETFSQLGEYIPGIEAAMDALPETSAKESEGLSGLLDKAAEYNETLSAINDVNKQFEALGLDPQMILGFVEQIQAYLDTEEGQQAKQLLMDSFANLTGKSE